MSDCCNEFVVSGLVPPFLLQGLDPELCLPPEEARINVGNDTAVPRSAVTAEDTPNQRRPAAPADFSRQIENELPFLRKIVRRWHRDRASADDLVQDTVLRALANAHLWQPGSNLRGWLVTIMRNQFLAAVGRSKRSAELMAMMVEPDICAPEPSSAKLTLRDVKRGLRRLSSIQRTVLLAVGADGKSYTEVAEMLGLSVGAVRCHLARARQRLRAAVDGEREAVPFATRVRKSAASPDRPPTPARSVMPHCLASRPTSPAVADTRSLALLGAD